MSRVRPGSLLGVRRLVVGGRSFVLFAVYGSGAKALMEYVTLSPSAGVE